MSDEIISILSSLGFDTTQGINLTGGEHEFYLDLVTDFCTEFLDNLAQLRDSTDISALLVQVHSLKAVLQTLGETRVAAKAEQLEATMRDGHLNMKQLGDLCQELQGFAEALKEARFK